MDRYYPPLGTRYYMPSIDGLKDDLVAWAVWTDTEWDREMLRRGLCFKTPEEARRRAEKILALHSKYMAIKKHFGGYDD